MRKYLVLVIMGGFKTRWFVVTQWNLECDYEKIISAGQVKYLAYGEETCPSTGKKHHQLFCYFHNPHSTGGSSLKKIGSMWGPIHCYVSPCKGSIEQNVAYCSKEGELIEVGTKPKQGCRADLHQIYDDIVGGTSVDDLAVDNPELFHQYGRTLDRLEGIALRKRYRTWMTEGVWIHGPSGVGKTHMALEGFTPETHYIKNLNEDWWDGYKGQEIVVLNEFRGQISFSELLDLVDKWPKTVKWRGKEPVPFLAKKVIVTSIKSPRDCYLNALIEDEPFEQFERRFRTLKLEQKCSEGNITPLSHVDNGNYKQGDSPAFYGSATRYKQHVAAFPIHNSDSSSELESLIDVFF